MAEIIKKEKVKKEKFIDEVLIFEQILEKEDFQENFNKELNMAKSLVSYYPDGASIVNWDIDTKKYKGIITWKEYEEYERDWVEIKVKYNLKLLKQSCF